MAWFSGNLPQLSSITDQISSFTKEVLTETTEEVEDPTAELQIARRKINELESLNTHIKSEWEKLKKHGEELSERAETAEYQIATISQEYRKLLQERDEELRRLKVDREKLREQQKGLVHGNDGGDSLQSPLKELASSQFFGENLISTSTSHLASVHNGPGGGDDGFEGVDLEGGGFHDFGDVISSQSEINRLQTELARLKVECQHWKAAAQQKENSLELEIRESDVAQLKGRIEELELSLQQEVTQHQRELSGLQTVQNERINSLSQRHQQEIDQLQNKIDELEKETVDGGHVTIGSSSGEKEGTMLKARCAELEEEVEKLTGKIGEMEIASESSKGEVKEEFQKLSSDYRRLSQVNSQLESQLRREQATMSDLHREIAMLKEQFSREKDAELAVFEHEKQELTTKLSDLQSDISNQESVLSRLQKEHGQSQLEVEQLTGQIERLSREVQEKETEIHSLKGVVKSDSKDRERTTSDLATVSRELEERDRLISQLKQSLGDQREVVRVKESELESHKKLAREACDREAVLKERCAELEQKHSQEAERLKSQIKDGTESVKSVQNETFVTNIDSERLSKLQGELSQSSVLLDEAKHELAKALAEKEKIMKQKDEEVTDFSKKLHTAKSELQQARAELLTVSAEKEMLNHQRSALQMEVTSLSQVRGQLESKVQSLEADVHSVQDQMRQELKAKEEECDKYSRQLAKLKTHLIEVEERYTQEAVLADQRETGLKQEAAKLQEQLKVTDHRGAVQSEQTQQQLDTAERELQIVMEARDDAVLKMTNAQEQARQNAAALRNLQAVLEEFQRDQSSELSQALKRSQNDLASALHESQQLKVEMEDLRAQLMEASSVAEAAAILNQELEGKERKVTELTREIENLNSSLAQKEQELDKLSRADTDRVDRSLVKNLVLGYIHANERKKPEVVQLIHKILDFSPEELEMAMRGSQGEGWLSGLWRRQPTTPKTPPPYQTTSLSRLFVSFLESESTPTAKPQPTILPTTSFTTPPGYIDPRTDPDRPSLATAPLLKPHPLHTPSHSPALPVSTKPVPEKPKSIDIPKASTNHSPVQQVAESCESRLSDQSKSSSSGPFLFTPARLNSADSAKPTEPSRSSQSSILRNVLSE